MASCTLTINVEPLLQVLMMKVIQYIALSSGITQLLPPIISVQTVELEMRLNTTSPIRARERSIRICFSIVIKSRISISFLVDTDEIKVQSNKCFVVS